mmetsp:Transcript_8596/g.25856  ORF Transcript_8596/g.25856 Transcript_8596/m.25856 type:complete len:245 (-) Transcript_8596:78-812(-)
MEAALYYADAPVYDDAAVDYADLGRPHAASAASEDGSWDDARAWQEEPRSRGRSRRELPAPAVAILKEWLLSPEHIHHPYPSADDQAALMAKTGIDKKQLKNWFTNARRRIWKPLRAAEGDAPDAGRPEPAEPSAGPETPFATDLLDEGPRRPDGGGLRKKPRRDGGRLAGASAACDLAVPAGAGEVCAFCCRARVDAALLPCRHYFHGACLRPWLEAAVTVPVCPQCGVAISNCVGASYAEAQ